VSRDIKIYQEVCRYVAWKWGGLCLFGSQVTSIQFAPLAPPEKVSFTFADWEIIRFVVMFRLFSLFFFYTLMTFSVGAPVYQVSS